jgi:uncharacterized protein
MMAPAMNTHPDEPLPYLELARQGARVVREFPAEKLERLADVAPGRGTLHLDMRFSMDGDGRPWVAGTAEVSVAATCQRCLGSFERPMSAAFELCIVRNPDTASELAAEADVLMLETDALTLAQVVEDELLLELPERLCDSEPCPHAPALEFPAPDAPEPDETDNPFVVLSQLKR